MKRSMGDNSNEKKNNYFVKIYQLSRWLFLKFLYIVDLAERTKCLVFMLSDSVLHCANCINSNAAERSKKKKKKKIQMSAKNQTLTLLG